MIRLVHKAALKRAEAKRQRLGQISPASRYQIAKSFYTLRLFIKREIINTFLIVLGIILAGFGLRSFLLPNHFLDGGITGISLLISRLSGFKLPYLIVLLNIPFIIVGYAQIGRNFVIKTTLGTIGLALCVAWMPYPVITSEIIGSCFWWILPGRRYRPFHAGWRCAGRHRGNGPLF